MIASGNYCIYITECKSTYFPQFRLNQDVSLLLLLLIVSQTAEESDLLQYSIGGSQIFLPVSFEAHI